jgi:hypothetical protein
MVASFEIIYTKYIMDLLNKLSKKKSAAPVTPKNNPIPKSGTSAVARFVFMDFCQPAKVYLVVALFTLIYYVYNDENYIWIILKAALFVVWGFAINRICLQNMKAVSWVMAIIPPFVFFFLTMKVSPAIPKSPKSAVPS